MIRHRPTGAPSRGGARGFTLIEVLAALVIIAIGMAAVLMTVGSSASTVSYLREKTLAEWIALNRIATTRLTGQLPSAGTTDGKLDFAGRKWRWQQVVSTAAVPGIYRIEVSVQRADTPQGDKAPWIASAMGAMGDAVEPPLSASQYLEYTGPGQPGQTGGSGEVGVNGQTGQSGQLSLGQSGPLTPAASPTAQPGEASTPSTTSSSNSLGLGAP